MNNSADVVFEQLSAFMDGELPEAEARFLQRRMESDAALREKWARMQLAATCIKGQPMRPMRGSLYQDINQVIALERSAGVRRPLLRWGMAASLMALAVLLAPRMMRNDPSQPADTVDMAVATPAADHLLASPGSADLVAARVQVPALEPAPSETAVVADPVVVSDLVASNLQVSTVESPLPLSAQSPADFPLIDSNDKRSWPRSGLAQAANDPALEAYLVRHNQMLANDGLGGFVPYLDVVAADQPGATPGQENSGQDAPQSGARDAQQ